MYLLGLSPVPPDLWKISSYSMDIGVPWGKTAECVGGLLFTVDVHVTKFGWSHVKKPSRCHIALKGSAYNWQKRPSVYAIRCAHTLDGLSLSGSAMGSQLLQLFLFAPARFLGLARHTGDVLALS